MQRGEVLKALGKIAQAQREYVARTTQYRTDFDRVMKRLVNEAAANMMSVEDVSRGSNLSPSRVRSIMRANALNPKVSKRLLAQTAADALASNAELLGIEPNQIDLMSPLAYLPAGNLLKQAVTDGVLATAVTSIPETLEDGIWCDACKMFESNDPELFRNDKCLSCGCLLNDHLDAKVVVA